jgi:hypothetical protein
MLAGDGVSLTLTGYLGSGGEAVNRAFYFIEQAGKPLFIKSLYDFIVGMFSNETIKGCTSNT